MTQSAMARTVGLSLGGFIPAGSAGDSARREKEAEQGNAIGARLTKSHVSEFKKNRFDPNNLRSIMRNVLSLCVLLLAVSCASPSCAPSKSPFNYDVEFWNDSPMDMDWVELVDGDARLSCGILEGKGAYSKVIMDCHHPLSGKEMRIEFFDDKIPVNARKIPQSIPIPPILDYNNKRIVIHILSPNKAKIELRARP